MVYLFKRRFHLATLTLIVAVGFGLLSGAGSAATAEEHWSIYTLFESPVIPYRKDHWEAGTMAGNWGADRGESRKKDFIVIDVAFGDVNGDGRPEKLYLEGTKRYPDSPAFYDIVLVIQIQETGKEYRIPLEYDIGYNPTLFLGDFTGDGVLDILVNTDSGGSGGITYDYVYTFLDNREQRIFYSPEWAENYQYDVVYRDNYKVQVINRTLKCSYTLDIMYKGDEYLSELYYASGELIRPVRGNVLPPGGVYPIDLQRDGVYELLVFQRVTGLYNADGLGFITTPLSWEGNAWVPVYQLLGIFCQESLRVR